MSREIGRTALVAFWLASVGPGVAKAAAQTSFFEPYPADASKPPPTGWTVTPGIALGTVWDDNVLSLANNDQPLGDRTNLINPSVGVSLNGRFDQLSGFYSGTLLRYRQFEPLNSYSQLAYASWRRLLSKRFTLTADESFAQAPTTELVQFVGVPFVNAGSTIQDARVGIEARLTGRTSILGGYNFSLVKFDTTPFTPQLKGGHSNGVSAEWRYKVSELTTFSVDYSGQQATVTNVVGTFVIQSIVGEVDRQISDLTYVFGGLGLARVSSNGYGPAQTGPSGRVGIARQFRRAGFDLTYSRSVVPSYGFGGTWQSQEVMGRARVPLARRLTAQSSIAWQSNYALTIAQPNLHSYWFEATVGYAWQPWLSLGGFYTRTNQTIERPGGAVDRRQVGIQVVTTRPMRVR
jgi:hypothetical protein